jgi:hypothetical protein
MGNGRKIIEKTEEEKQRKKERERGTKNLIYWSR